MNENPKMLKLSIEF